MSDAPRAAAQSLEQFMALLESALARGQFQKCVLSKPRAAGSELERVALRRILLKDEDAVSFAYHYKTRDVTKNSALAETPVIVRELATDFAHIHLLTATEEIQLRANKKGERRLIRGKAAPGAEAKPDAHDREKRRHVDIAKPFLRALGVTDAQGGLIPAMSRKWKQINKFIEILDHAFKASALAEAAQVRVADFGSGKGYLTFAVHDYLRDAGIEARVTGVELREDMVRLCNDAAASLRLPDLRFVLGDVRHDAPDRIDIMIALHACDTATDHAIHAGIRGGAAIIMCSPCCHKEIRPQMHSPAPLQALLRHGIHLGQEAEMVTDTLRALLLEAQGYSAQVFEFVSLEHTSKNKMILAVKRKTAGGEAQAREQIAQIKAFYGVREHCLEALLGEVL